MLAEAVIPSEWRSVVCQCPRAWPDDTQLGFPKRVFRDDGTRIFTCVVCKKPSSHCLYRCQDCSSVFLKDFGHHLWVLDWPKCWACLNKGSDRAAEIILGSVVQRNVSPVLRYLYLHIIEPENALELPDFLK